MKKMSTEEIRNKWINFFKSKDHYVLPYSSLVPVDDPSLLWINSGVATLKPFFEGKKNPPAFRLVNSQKSIRTNDIENVGYTTRHHTLFEMLGNFSIGDYFKEDAIAFAWEFLISKQWMGLDPDKIYITVYEKDDITYNIWLNDIKIPANKIIKGSKKQNFWEIGEGPSGPNTEIFYDRGEKYDPQKIGLKLLTDDIENDRYLEVWNIVFSEFNADGKGNYTPLPRKNIDTGAGLERLATIIQDVPTSFDIDIFQKIIAKIEELTNNSYKYDPNAFFTKENKQLKTNISFKIIADHIRAIVFTIADGVYPSNKAQGYVIRKLIRRSAIYGKKINIKGAFLYKLVDTVVKVMGPYYEYLKSEKNKIKEIILAEEQKFILTLVQGEEQLNFFINKNKIVTPANAFMLFESYGYPFEIIQEICKEHNINLKQEDFDKFLDNHKKIAQENQKKVQALFKQNEFLIKTKFQSKFVGYQVENCNDSIVKFLFKDNSLVKQLSNCKGFIILDKTPFYAEKGGQAADNGIIKNDNAICQVIDVQIGPNNEFIHYVDISGTISQNDVVQAIVNHEKRMYTMKNHSGTHILHAAIRKVLGENAMQVGSYNNEKYLRIDVTFNKKITLEDVRKINDLCTNAINKQMNLEVINCSYEEALSKYKALAFFKDKYNQLNEVRVIKFNDFSSELCGGTHVNNSIDIESLLITKCSSIGNNVYRFQALTSFLTINDYLQNLIEDFNKLENDINFINEQLVNKQVFHFDKLDNKNLLLKFEIINKNIELAMKLKTTLKIELDNQISNKNFQIFNDLQPININGLNFIKSNCNNLDSNTIKKLIDFYRNKYKTKTLIIFNNVIDDNKGVIFLGITNDLTDKYNCKNLIKKLNVIINGKGGGNSIYAQTGYINNMDFINNFINNDIKGIL